MHNNSYCIRQTVFSSNLPEITVVKHACLFKPGTFYAVCTRQTVCQPKQKALIISNILSKNQCINDMIYVPSKV